MPGTSAPARPSTPRPLPRSPRRSRRPRASRRPGPRSTRTRHRRRRRGTAPARCRTRASGTRRRRRPGRRTRRRAPRGPPRARREGRARSPSLRFAAWCGGAPGASEKTTTTDWWPCPDRRSGARRAARPVRGIRPRPRHAPLRVPRAPTLAHDASGRRRGYRRLPGSLTAAHPASPP